MNPSPEDFPDRVGLIPLDEAAYLMGLAASTIRKWRHAGRIPPECVVRVSPRKYMYVESEIIKVMGKGDIYDPTLYGDQSEVSST